MKKLSTRSVLAILLIAASICSYVYLNTVPTAHGAPTVKDNEAPTTEIEDLDETDSQQKEVILPDVQMVKKVIETGKRLIPAY